MTKLGIKAIKSLGKALSASFPLIDDFPSPFPVEEIINLSKLNIISPRRLQKRW